MVSKHVVSTGKKSSDFNRCRQLLQLCLFSKDSLKDPFDNEEAVGVLYTNRKPIDPHYLGSDPAAELAHVAVQLVPALDQRGHPAANQG